MFSVNHFWPKISAYPSRLFLLFAHYRGLSSCMLDQLFWKQLYWFAMNCPWKICWLFVILFSSRRLCTAWIIAYLLICHHLFSNIYVRLPRMWLPKIMLFGLLRYYRTLLGGTLPCKVFRFLNSSKATEMQSRHQCVFSGSVSVGWM